jgi:DNA polymerase sigma
LFYKFDLIGIGKLDVTVGNKTAIKNSEIIGYFARIPEVACFCLLVKLWAKNNSVINAKTPMKGLSSYGVILMCLYYLMETKQIDFLYFEG